MPPPCRQRIDRPHRLAEGPQARQIYPMTMVWVRNDEGVTGIVEAMAMDHMVMEQMRAKYIGRDIWEMAFPDESPTMQCALYDIAGQALGVPIASFALLLQWGARHWTPEDRRAVQHGDRDGKEISRRHCRWRWFVGTALYPGLCRATRLRRGAGRAC